MNLIALGIAPWHWAFGGLGIAASTLALLFLTNRRLGVSTGYENVCAIVSKQLYFDRPTLHAEGRWRMYFLVGLIFGGALSAWLSGNWRLHWDLGMFDTVVGWGAMAKLGWMFAGGLLMGFGTRLAGGCTSGHGIFGMANFERASLIATLAFMAAGVVTTQFVYRVLFS